jgi:hypothetical protein
MTKTGAISLAKQQAKRERQTIFVVLDPHYVNCYGVEEGYNVATMYDLGRWYQGVAIEYVAEHKPHQAAEGGRDG